MKKNLLLGFALLSYITTNAQWTDDSALNTNITPQEQAIYGDDFAVNKDGMIFYNFNGPINGTTATFLQILDQAGNKTLPEPGITISNERALTYVMVNQMIMTDRQGNAIISVSDCRYSPIDSHDLSYTLYKVSPKGEMLWGNTGIPLEKGKTRAIEAKMNMIQLEDESYVFAWTSQEINDGPFSIHIERLSEEGEFLWESSINLADEKINYCYPWIVNAGDNQFILIYAKGTNQDLVAQKYDFDGTPVWPKEVTIYRGGFGTIPIWTFVDIIPDKEGGAFIGWYDDRYFTNLSKAYVSHVTADGELGFISGIEGTALSNSEYLMGLGPKLAYDEKTKSLFTVHRECDGNQSFHKLTLQKISMDGELLWGSEGKDLVPLQDNCNLGYYSIQTTDDSDVVVFYMYLEGLAANGNVNAYAVRIDGESENADFVWGENPVFLSTAKSNKSSLTSSALVNGTHYVTMWKDDRIKSTEEGTSDGSFMQCITPDGKLYTNTSSINHISSDDSQIFTASASHKNIIFNINGTKKENATISIYNVTGQKIGEPVNVYLENTLNQVEWNAGHLHPGIYIAQLNTAEKSASIRFIVK